MRKILIFILITICSNLFAQVHVEYISEKSDTMALINKHDIDVINNVFNERNRLDSLNVINTCLIEKLELKSKVLDSIIINQIQTIENDKLLQKELEDRNNQVIATYTKELKQEKSQRISFQALTGAGIIAIILLIFL